MNVLSLFDGLSCGQIALKQLGIIPDMYYASEIDKHAIKQTQLNFPATVQLGDVVFLRRAMCFKNNIADKLNRSFWLSEETKKRFNKLRSIKWNEIDLVLAGSPCQGFSFAGKQLAFDDPRSKLFFEFIKILNHIRTLNPNVLFLLENVNMKKAHMRIISEYCGVFPVNINSNLVSAQNRDRWYWTNIRTKQVGLFGEVYTDIPQPQDKGIFLLDILENKVDEKYYIKSGKMLDFILNKQRQKKKYTQIDGDKSLPMMARTYQSWNGNYTCVAMCERESFCLTPKRTEYGKSIRKDYESGRVKEQRKNIQELEPRSDGKTNCLTSVQKDNLILQRARGNNKGGLLEDKAPTLSACAWEQNNLVVSGSFRTFKDGGFIEIKSSKAACVTARARNDGSGQGGCIINWRIRRLTPTECSRLQTIPSWYRWECSDTQIYKMLGNGWTVDVIVHILSFMKRKLNINVARKG